MTQAAEPPRLGPPGFHPRACALRLRSVDVSEDIDDMQSDHREECPACLSPGLLNGDPIGTVDTSIGDDEVIQRQAMLPSSFECVACRLKISGFFKLSACGMGNASPRLHSTHQLSISTSRQRMIFEDARRDGKGYEVDNNE